MSNTLPELQTDAVTRARPHRREKKPSDTTCQPPGGHAAPTAMSAAEKAPAPWHGDFAGNATDGLLLLGATVLAFCILSGQWWLLRAILFFGAMGVLLFLWSLYLECALTARDGAAIASCADRVRAPRRQRADRPRARASPARESEMTAAACRPLYYAPRACACRLPAARPSRTHHNLPELIAYRAYLRINLTASAARRGVGVITTSAEYSTARGP